MTEIEKVSRSKKQASRKNRKYKKNGKPKMALWKKLLLTLTLAIFLFLGAIFAYSAIVLNKTEDVFKSTFSDLGLKSSKKSDDIIKATQPLTILLMGVDTGDEGRSDPWAGQSDTMIIMTLNPKTHTTTMVSLERDMLTDIVDKNGKIIDTAKLNAAYANGGAVNAVSTIQQQIGLDIDKYALINMNGLKELVDAVGGVDVNNTLGDTISIEETEPDYKATVEPGKQHINGDQALVYSRMRHQDPEGDIGRQARQREVIEQLVSKILSLNSITKYEKILKAISGNLKTDFAVTGGSLKSLIGYKDAFQKIRSVKLQGVGEMLSDISYQVMPADNLLSVQNALRLSIGKPTIDSLSPNIVTFENYFGGYSPDATPPTVTTTVSGKSTDTVLQPDGSEVSSKASSE
ncbi:LCP family protein [Lactococcus paracarnosus]|uniref:LCP family protein n=1 Tax=Pseudolactococcus paracarnosus TaxID=2749962 RepID=A0ABT0AJA2_9LACT|nr:LCP family protein [Lactococcus paracarnosus]SPC35951.1 Biofilm regulatory protein A [Lactococcus piscium]MCJ1976596.1 LCP family protein [Lactococcus paracarnosus]MCJ1982613.1 LCP family protein [Lactococcus paracarnosus]MCJ1993523.1 LCP family protein [Lactococcus paracarnosus]MCJ1997607.1 LCP family protein [Lactococcus paracarnosus]